MNSRTLMVLPTFNNAATLRRVIDAAKATHLAVLVVDDGSTDETPAILAGAGLTHIITHQENLGKGAAIRSGMFYAKSLGFTGIIVCDTDGQHLPKSTLEILQRAEQSDHTIVIGCRRFGSSVPGSSKFGRRFSNFWVRLETGKELLDTQSGMRFYPVNDRLMATVHRNAYDFEIEVLVRGLWLGFGVAEVDIDVIYPPKAERVSHFHKFWDNLRLTKLHTYLCTLRVIGMIFGWGPAAGTSKKRLQENKKWQRISSGN